MKNCLIFLIPVFLIGTLKVQAQFEYEFISTPDSAEVWVNDEMRCHTPCEVKFFWREAKGGQMKFEVKLPWHKTWADSLTKKPKQFNLEENVVLEWDLPKYEFDSLTAAVAFDKLLADGFNDGQSIGSITKIDGSIEPIEWEGTVKVGAEAFEKKFYEVIEKTGFRTPATASAELFREDQRKAPVLPRFIVGLKLVDYRVDMRVEKRKGRSSGNEIVGRTKMDFEWQVLDKKTGKVALSYHNQGVANLRQRAFQRSPNNLMAFEGALIDFLSNSEFFELVNTSRQGVIDYTPDKELPTGESYSLENVSNPAFDKTSEMIQFANKACVTIITDRGHGSGVIIDKSGLVVSAYHVVEGVNRIEVKFTEGMVLDAEVLAHNEKSDVVLLKISGSGFRALPVNLTDIAIGEDVVTIGTPHSVDLGQSVSRGMISGKRQNENEIVIQADISVSPGNSGGPLLNENGEVVGIVQQKIIQTGVEGIGFALPIKRVLELLNVTVKE